MRDFLIFFTVIACVLFTIAIVAPKKELPSVNFTFETKNQTIPVENKKIVLIATGDVIPARMVNVKTIERNNFNWPCEKTADFLKTGDITIINLEAALLNNCPVLNSGFKFCGDKRHVNGMVFAGVDIAGLVNNHSGNFGSDGIIQTKQILKDNDIDSFAENEIVYKTVKGTKFSFLGFDSVSNHIDDFSIVKTARENSDVVVVSAHWGAEYRDKPDARQIELAHKIIDRGADIIIGNHPHWIQPEEIYKDKLIVYAHGNFIFDQEWSEKTKLGEIGKYTFIDKKLTNVEFIPIKIIDFGQPNFR